MNQKTKTITLALLVMALWGSLFPCIKIGYKAFDIDPNSVADILMFAAMRFTLCGAAITSFCFLMRKRLPAPPVKEVRNILWIGVFAVALHYAFSYIGLSITESAKTALLKQAGALIYVCFAFLFIKEETFSIFKILGAIVGFFGIVALNMSSGGFSFGIGDVLILGASVCTVVSNIISRRSVQNVSAIWLTGISQLFGGAVLLILALAMGGKLPRFTADGALIFTYICIASIASYCLWYYTLKASALSHMFLIKFAEPVFACIFGAILLGENILRPQYLAAFVLICAGIVIGHCTYERKRIKHD